MPFIEDGHIDLAQLTHYHQEGLITSRAHPQGRLLIHNYTQRCQFNKTWDEVTRHCRGLITDLSGKIVARGFPKFFNLEELSQEEQQALEGVPFSVTNKEDGSLGILYPQPDGTLAVATRGSFTSEQAIKATKILHSQYPDLVSMFYDNDSDALTTILVEIIYPENRIVVNYGNESKLTGLAAIDPVTGNEVPRHDFEEFCNIVGMPIVELYDVDDYRALQQTEVNNKEGVVVQFHTNPVQRVKLKYAEYIRLHRLVTGINEQFVWDILRQGKSLDPTLQELVTEEHYQWIREVEARLQAEYKVIRTQCHNDFKRLETRKETAMYFLTCAYPKILFLMLDNKPSSGVVWKLIKPSGNQAPIKEDME